MIDFLKIGEKSTKNGIEIYPKFIIRKSKDLMIRGGDFYAIWIEEFGRWSTDEQDALQLIDNELSNYYKEKKKKTDNFIKVLYMWDAESGMIDVWHKYCQRQMRDNFHSLDEKIIFANSPTNKEDYSSKRLSYSLEKGDISSYDKLVSTLYSEEERNKIEWAIGSIVNGDSKYIQKFVVFYGESGAGKSTILNIIQKLFDGYYSVFNAKALGSSSNVFALEAFKHNPLVAIEHDADLSHIEDNTRINSLVSHEMMTVNEKFKSTYSNRFKCFLFIGTNKPVRITDAKSGLIRRLIDITPSGKKVSLREYNKLTKQIDFELGAIAYHCKEVYESDPNKYDDYIPTRMLGASNDFYNFIEDNYFRFKEENVISLKSAWKLYNQYCEDAKVPYPYSQRMFREELRNYYEDFQKKYVTESGTTLYNCYIDFKFDKFDSKKKLYDSSNKETVSWLKFDKQDSALDILLKDAPAQYASTNETPIRKWDKVKTKLSQIKTSKLHYVKPQDIDSHHIVIDFDLKDKDGNKSLELNMKAANKFPPTYAELSKSEQGIHLHYIYTGDASKLSRIYDNDIEIKIFTEGSSLRRKLTKCNDLPINKINSGLPLREERQMISFNDVLNEKGIRTLILNNINKQYHPYTKPSIDFIYQILEDAYEKDLKYDVSDLRNAVLGFAANSTHNPEYCIRKVNDMKLKNYDGINDAVYGTESDEEKEIILYDVEVFPNLFIICWKHEGEGKTVVKMINPKPSEVEDLFKFNLVGFNCRRYDNHILYARAVMGYNNEQLYNLSQNIIENGRGFFSNAYGISYTDIYDYSSKKQSLKKWEISLKINHRELGLPWNEPVDESLWNKVEDYCVNDVLATDAVWNATKGDFKARQILADLAGMTVNDTTNTLTTKIIFGNERHPQSEFNYRNLGEMNDDDYIPEGFDEYTRFNKNGQPVFPGYKFENGKSFYRNEEIGEGGQVYAEVGIHVNLKVLDIMSMHPHTIIAENLFGKYTKNFKDILDARIAIKHKDFDKAKTMLDGKLEKYLNDTSLAKDLAGALKIAINSVYGLTFAKFDNAFRDRRNIDNIVAKRGALFMTNLKYEVQKRGFTVAHIKTDSIKIPNPTPEIIKFVEDYGKMYGYIFELESEYERMCLVNDSTYIAKTKDGKWTATATQFKVPYVFKTLFTKESIGLDDVCETKSVSKGDIYLNLNEGYPDVTEEKKERKKLEIQLKSFKKNNRVSDIERAELRIKELDAIIDKSSNYVFVGRVGQFCPVKDGVGGGSLVRKTIVNGETKYYSVQGAQGYKWLESEVVKNMEAEYGDIMNVIDMDYYHKLADKAIADISFLGDYEWFVSDDKEDLKNKKNIEEGE